MPAPCTVMEPASACDAATRPYRSGPLTVAGRALAKHNPVSRPGSAFPPTSGGPAALNERAHEVVGDILAHPRSVCIDRGNVWDIVSPDGRGVRFHADGSLKGFLEP